MLRNFPSAGYAIEKLEDTYRFSRHACDSWIITNPSSFWREGPCCEMVKKKPPGCPQNWLKKKQNVQPQKNVGRWKKWPPSFLPPFFFVAKSFARKKWFAIECCSSWYQIRSMQHVNHEAVKPQSKRFYAAIFQTLEVPKRELLAWQELRNESILGTPKRFRVPKVTCGTSDRPDTTGGASSFPEAPHCCFPTGTLVPKRSMWMSLAEKSLHAAAGKCQQIHRKSDT